MSKQAMEKKAKWEAVVYGISKRPWFLRRHSKAIYYRNTSGQIVYFTSSEAANRCACKLNSAEED